MFWKNIFDVAVVKNSIWTLVSQPTDCVRLRYKIHWNVCNRLMRRMRCRRKKQLKWHFMYNINSVEVLLNCDNSNHLLMHKSSILSSPYSTYYYYYGFVCHSYELIGFFFSNTYFTAHSHTQSICSWCQLNGCNSICYRR